MAQDKGAHAVIIVDREESVLESQELKVKQRGAKDGGNPSVLSSSHFLSLSLTFSHFLSLSLTFSHFLEQTKTTC